MLLSRFVVAIILRLGVPLLPSIVESRTLIMSLSEVDDPLDYFLSGARLSISSINTKAKSQEIK